MYNIRYYSSDFVNLITRYYEDMLLEQNKAQNIVSDEVCYRDRIQLLKNDLEDLLKYHEEYVLSVKRRQEDLVPFLELPQFKEMKNILEIINPHNFFKYVIYTKKIQSLLNELIKSTYYQNLPDVCKEKFEEFGQTIKNCNQKFKIFDRKSLYIKYNLILDKFNDFLSCNLTHEYLSKRFL